jgi:quinol monooxygenase YgiN
MTDSEDFLTASLHHGNLQVDTGDPNPRPMIAILDAKPGLAEEFRSRIVELVRAVRREPGCVTFTAYEARDTPGRFYLYEVYADAAAFGTHLQTEHVRRFISSIPALSTGGPASLIQLNEIPVPDGFVPRRPTARRARRRSS